MILFNDWEIDSDDPKVLVPGVGVWSLSTLKESVAGKLGDLEQRAGRGDFKMLDSQINKSDTILKRMVRAVVDAEAALEL